MRARHYLITSCVLGLVFLFATSAIGQSSDWVIAIQGTDGPITGHTSKEDLLKHFGAADVVDKDIDIGEGETEPGTIVFPNDPKKTIEILWKDKEKASIKSAQIYGDASRWKAPLGVSLGVSLGISLKELEAINKNPFTLMGFEWDYSGTVMSWKDGSLAKDFVRIIVRLQSLDHPQVNDAEYNEVQGESEFLSQHPVMQKLNPRVYQIIWNFE